MPNQPNLLAQVRRYLISHGEDYQWVTMGKQSEKIGLAYLPSGYDGYPCTFMFTELKEPCSLVFDINFAVSKAERRRFRQDFERAIVALCERGVALSEALERLSLKNLGGFYARPSVMWFPLDDAAKIYPISMEHDRQQMFRL